MKKKNLGHDPTRMHMQTCKHTRAHTYTPTELEERKFWDHRHDPYRTWRRKFWKRRAHILDKLLVSEDKDYTYNPKMIQISTNQSWCIMQNQKPLPSSFQKTLTTQALIPVSQFIATIQIPSQAKRWWICKSPPTCMNTNSSYTYGASIGHPDRSSMNAAMSTISFSWSLYNFRCVYCRE